MLVHRLLQSVPKVSSLAMRVQGGRPAIAALQRQPIAFISTSKKNRDTTITADQTTGSSSPKTVEDFANPNLKKNYQSYGFEKDPEWDLNIRYYIMFWTVTMGLVLAGFIITYFPDVRMKEWTSREAYIELARREALGLPPVDANYVPPETVPLPSDEELGDYEIII